MNRLAATREVLRRHGLVLAPRGTEATDRIIELGCGPGSYVPELLETRGRVGPVVGVDPSGDIVSVVEIDGLKIETGSPRPLDVALGKRCPPSGSP
jgi:trans-aconitate methyltransferase